MNPAIDLFIRVERLLAKGTVNRTLYNEIIPNGKGVNISFLLAALGIENTALGFSAGFTGRFIEDELRKKNIKTNFIQCEGITRINVFTQVQSENTDYQLVNGGPAVNEHEVGALLAHIGALGPGDILCVSGSNPPGVPAGIFATIAQTARRNGFALVLDVSSAEVPELLFCKPLLLKPTLEELALWAGEKSFTKEEALRYAKTLIGRGAQNILVSMGAEGAYYVNEKRVVYANAPQGSVVNTACAGDTMVASFLYKMISGCGVEECLRFAVAAASSTAFRPGLTDYSDTAELMKQVDVISC